MIGKGGSKFNNLDVKRVYFGLVWFSHLPISSTDALVGTGFETTARSDKCVITQWTLIH